MARFLNTSATNYYLEDLIKQARERLIIISPSLKFNARVKELLEDKDRMKIDVRIVYGRSELAPQEINWLRSLESVRTSFCRDLHARCYLNERAAIVTSMNLNDFSQANNSEMGVLIERDSEGDLYGETYEEAQRLIRVSEQVRLSAEMVEDPEEARPPAPAAEVGKPAESTPERARPAEGKPAKKYEKLTTAKLARKLRMRTAELNERLVVDGLLCKDGDELKLTPAGQAAGGELRVSKQFGPFHVWPPDLSL